MITQRRKDIFMKSISSWEFYMKCKTYFRLVFKAGICYVAISFLCQFGNAQSLDGKKELSNRSVVAEILTIAPSKVTESVEVVGNLSAKFQVNVRSEYPGVVREVYVTEWVRVKKGDLLAKLDSRETEAMITKTQASVELARANLFESQVASQRAEREYYRILNLIESGLATRQSLDEADTLRHAASARQSAALAQLNAAEQDLKHAKILHSKTMIYAPINGVIAQRSVNKGDMVTDKTLFRIVDNSILDLTVTVPSKYMRHLKKGINLIFTTDAFPGKVFEGKLMYINPEVNEADRSVKVIAEVPNPSEMLKSGMFIQGKIFFNERDGAILVPRTALLDWDVPNQTAQLFKVENGIAKRHPVRLGNVTEDQVEITEGVSIGDQIIVRGGFNIKDGDAVTVVKQ